MREYLFYRNVNASNIMDSIDSILPVPSEPQMFELFRTINLKVSPDTGLPSKLNTSHSETIGN